MFKKLIDCGPDRAPSEHDLIHQDHAFPFDGKRNLSLRISCGLGVVSAARSIQLAAGKGHSLNLSDGEGQPLGEGPSSSEYPDADEIISALVRLDDLVSHASQGSLHAFRIQEEAAHATDYGGLRAPLSRGLGML